MGHSRPRYNAKGRGLPGDGSSKSIQEHKKNRAAPEDSNVDMIDPAEAAQARAQRRAALLTNNGSQQSSEKMSSKKKKRLDNFINKQLKKEKRVELLKDIAAYQSALPEDVQLQSSSSLGSRKMLTAQDKLEKAQALQMRRHQSRKNSDTRDLSSDSEDDLDDGEPVAPGSQPSKPSKPYQSPPLASALSEPTPSTSAITLGSGLKRSADGQLPQPTITKRRRIRKTPWGRLPAEDMDSEDEDESDFDSSDSAMDSDDDGDDKGDASQDSEGEESADPSGEDAWGGIESDRDSQGNLRSLASDQDAAETDLEEDSEGVSKESGGSDDEEGEAEGEEEEQRPRRQRGTFKAWAEAQRDQVGNQPTQAEKPMTEQMAELSDLKELQQQHQSKKNGAGNSKKGANSVALPEGVGPLGEVMKMPTNSLALGPQSSDDFKRRTVSVDRPEAIQEGRMQLPILAEEDPIMHLIRHQAVVVLSGETGSGKTTQVPQFLYEAGFGAPGSENPGMIAVTQPRRVAAVSMAQRVRTELGLPSHSHVVAHQVRYDSTSARETRIKFMTDGVLLRELGIDFLLRKYSVIIVDEAHERTVNTDILLGVLSRVVKLREQMWRKQEEGVKPLRLVIMSATLRLADFLNNRSLFPKTPEAISVESRQYPVTTHFARRTRSDYLGEAFKKVCKIHARLPQGGILVFLTGQNEIQALCKRLEKRWSKKALAQRKAAREQAAARQRRSRDDDDDDGQQSSSEDDDELSNMALSKQQDAEAEDVDLGQDRDLVEGIDDRNAAQEADEEDLESDDDENDNADDKDLMMDDSDLLKEESEVPLYILPLYSLLPTEKQMRVFEPVPEGHRLVVVSTNVAETSLTIPGIRYVVDSGRAKERHYNTATGMQSFQVSWVSKASASQRSGRAGRVGPGHCYRLYSSAVYERYLDDHAKPEILRTPVDSMVLQMKSMNIDVVTNFPFPTAPDRDAMHKAETLLTHLGALQMVSQKKNGSKSASSLQVTELGRAMSLFPLPPRLAKMLVAGQQHGCLPYVIVLVCALVVGDPFLREDAVGAEDTLEEQDMRTEALSVAQIQHIRNTDLKAKELRRLQRKQFFQTQAAHSALGAGTSDMFKLLSAVGAYEYEGGSTSFCEQNFLRPKAMQEIHKLRSQISRIVMANFPKVDAGFTPSLPPPSELQLKVLRQLIVASFIDQTAVRKDLVDPTVTMSAKHAGSGRHVAYRALGVPGEDVFIHPSSVLFAGSPPEFVCYQELFRSSQAYLKGNTKVPANWLSTLGRAFCSFTKVLETPDQLVRPGAADGKSKTLQETDDGREVFVTPTFGDGSWGKGVELPPLKMKQRREGSRWVFVG